ncbi:MAG: DUF4910 domain-containing protein [Pirellulaceae bacterium]|nr:DUF4910 domain-containing protein [Pirellulaceae bacterium]
MDSIALPSVATASGMFDLASRLFPLHRSLTGEGVRRTLHMLADYIPLEIHDVPSGTRLFDWQVPDEWNVRDACIADERGRRVVDYQQSNLHVVAYSRPVRRRLSWSELRPHVCSLPEHPDWIPYRTAYFEDRWGFCLTHRQFQELDQWPDAEYDVLIDATREPGSLTYGECVLPGRREEQVLVSAHVCHPSLANDNLSAVVVATAWACWLAERPREYTYRFVFAPATLGALAWLHANRSALHRVRHGLVLALLGDAGPLTYKRTRRGNAAIDRAAQHVLRHAGTAWQSRSFTPWGYDERQFASPGFDLPVGCLMRTPPGEYPQYHTSADNLQLIKPDSLGESLDICRRITQVLEADRVCVSRCPYGEPHLAGRGLHAVHGQSPAGESLAQRQALLWTLNLADGQHTMLEIAERAELPFDDVRQAAERLGAHELLEMLPV